MTISFRTIQVLRIYQRELVTSKKYEQQKQIQPYFITQTQELISLGPQGGDNSDSCRRKSFRQQYGLVTTARLASQQSTWYIHGAML